MKKVIYFICLSFLFYGCSKSSSDDIDPNNGDSIIGDDDQSPTAILDSKLVVKLEFPHEKSLCNEGIVIDSITSNVIFEWQASEVAENYKITVENLLTGNVIEKQTTEDKIGIVINRATPYSWFVESSFGSRSKKSDVWKFFNAGPGVKTYPPFPATINSPEMAAVLNASSSVSLNWQGNDLDNDIVGYDVYFGTSKTPEIYTQNISETTLSVPVASGKIYYWQIVTKDAVGNNSYSDIFQFKVL